MIAALVFKSLYENQVLVVNALLQQLKVKVNINTIDDTLQNHPDYPSFLSITDSLRKWNIESLAIQTSTDKLDEIPVPFITSLKSGVFVTISAINKQRITVHNQHGKKELLERENFLKQWTETIIVVEANEKSGEPDYKKKLNQSITKSIAYTLIPITFLIAILWPFIIGTVGIVPTSYLLLKLVGLTISLLLLWYDIDKGNPLLKQICSGIQKANCNAVLNTQAASLFGILTWSEVGFFYFAGGLLFVAFMGINEIMPVLSSLSLLAFPYTFFSIYYQWKVVKQWCVLCLMVQAVLLLETILVLTSMPISAEAILATLNNNMPAAIISLAIPVITWFLIKPLLKQLQIAKHEKRSYLQLKYNDQIFWSLLQKQKSILAHSTEGLGITIGNPQAKNTIVKVCNPYCGPCANAHLELEQLLENNKNVKIQIIFTASNDEGDFRAKPVKHLLAIYKKGDFKVTNESLDFWYRQENKDYSIFKIKYPINSKDLDSQILEISKMRNWCNTVEITATPTCFINGYKLSKNYSITDLVYFLN